MGWLDRIKNAWDPEAALRWIETQPEGQRTEQLRARIKLAHQKSSAARQ